MFKGATATVPLYIVKHGSTLLGMDVFKALKCMIINDNTLIVPISPTPVHSVDTTVTDGYMNGFVHRAKICIDITPVQQKLRRLPFSTHRAVSEEIQSLL